MGKEIEKTQWFGTVKENWQIDDFTLNRIQTRLSNKNTELSMENIENVILELIDLGYIE